MWLVAHVALLLSIFSPFAIITIWFMMIPIVILFTQLTAPRFVVFYGVSQLVLIVLFNGLGLLGVLFSLFLLPTAVVMGYLYKKNSSAKKVLTTSSLIMLSQLILTLLVITLSGVNVFGGLQEMLTESMTMLPETMKQMMTEDMLEQVIFTIQQMLPFYFICFSVISVAVTHTITRKIMNRTETKIAGLPPIRDWKLPKSLVWYFIISMFLDFFMRFPPEHMITMILRNIIPLLTLAFTVQAVAFLFFMSHTKKWNKTLPIFSIIVVIIFPFVQLLFSILGIIDVAFPLRERIKNQ